MEQELKSLRDTALKELSEITNKEALNDVKIKYLGKKGLLTGMLRGLGALSPEERPRIGQVVNEIRGQLEKIIADKLEAIKQAELTRKLASETIDVTLPGRIADPGHLHPLTLTLNRIKDTFMRMGFEIAEGPEVEKDYYNFEALNLPQDHPARDMQDSFYITKEFLLRTHTSPVQVRTMQSSEPNQPIRIIAPGKVYRRDYDATHSPMFQQVEGLVVDKNISFADLKGTLELFSKEIFGNRVKVRFRPSFFPFTEPSAEVDISCVMCEGKGCRVCSGTGWLEILGSGMVHPRVLEMSKFDPDKVSGFAFGMGVERIAMLTYGIDDLRLFFDNDIRFLRQF
ncbi:phenylalanine--tRNA ligase subunit alpha [Sporomusa acidovorans]|uniref:Phenylalanine--tRNA ligase alpha subunit n=1 Tax=Sporomusa acidovorans (strain ATCC 49682 / DSM 3132 / Mol) TaxID=1123286 RepID=A0ABZ3J3I5_SPOA4|nr:phenylalanine--tRNA ligase subunit alpha [Sporomusa acidovorans]OZC20917.1 phenylalanine--tRNA ligase alpha subunit [Sporomusa acidovorans DSM 3132]SDE60988.1 phenylalanyl-tRNA synthetase, alpha subunit [Sporomusa acidovorans]